MADSSEIIVQKYFEMKGYFLRMNERFQVPRGYSDIDLIGLDKEGKGIVIEVKAEFPDTGFTRGKGLIDWFTNYEQPFWDKVKEVLRDVREIRKVLVLARIGKRSSERVYSYAKTKGVEIKTFEEIIKELLDGIDTNPHYDSETLQLIRMLKEFRQA